MRVYPFRTTFDKITQHVARVESAGDTVEHFVFVGGRDWVLICREGTAPDVAIDDSADARRRVADGLERGRAAAPRFVRDLDAKAGETA